MDEDNRTSEPLAGRLATSHGKYREKSHRTRESSLQDSLKTTSFEPPSQTTSFRSALSLFGLQRCFCRVWASRTTDGGAAVVEARTSLLGWRAEGGGKGAGLGGRVGGADETRACGRGTADDGRGGKGGAGRTGRDADAARPASGVGLGALVKVVQRDVGACSSLTGGSGAPPRRPPNSLPAVPCIARSIPLTSFTSTLPVLDEGTFAPSSHNNPV